MYKFSQKTFATLQRTGWEPDRQVDISGFVNDIEQTGFGSRDAVERFLQNFAGLIFTADMGPTADFSFSLIAPRGEHWKQKLSYCRTRIGKAVYPVGWGDGYHVIILMDETGSFYANADDYLWKIGNSVEETLEGLIEGGPDLERYDQDLLDRIV